MTPDSAAICVSYHAGHRKSGGLISPERHERMLCASIARLRRAPYPVIVSCIGGTISPAALAEIRAGGPVTVIEESDYGHQQGALVALINGLQAAHTLGVEWLFFTAEDVIFSARDPVGEALREARAREVDYYCHPWLDEIGIEGVSAQVALMRVSALYRPGFEPLGVHLFSGYQGIEHYIAETLRQHRIPYARDPGLWWWHTHDADEFERLLGAARAVLIRFTHGLGDAVQLTAVLAHLRKHRPHWRLDLATRTGKAAGASFCHRLFNLDCDAVEDRDYDEVFDLEWPENDTGTKTTKCLREVFGVEPEGELLRYRIALGEGSIHRAAAYLERIGCERLPNGRFNAVCFHYEGNTSADRKNLHSITVGAVCETLIGRFVPIVLDWDARSPLPDQRSIFCPVPEDQLWAGTGTGDAEILAALIEQCSAFVGVDSGPLHVAGATSTPTIGVWTEHEPRRFFDPHPHAVHLIPAAMREQPGHATLRYKTREISDAIVSALDGFGIASGEKARGFAFNKLEQEWEIIEDVYARDSYCTALLPRKTSEEIIVDVGANIGAFARLWHERNPHARIICIEACPENIPVLQRNVGAFATVVHAACTYDAGPLFLLNACGPDGVSTGGSRVVGREEFDSETRPHYQHDYRPLPVVTLHEVMSEHGLARIDLLKLDCEGSEFSILPDAPLGNIGFILGEYHSRARWDELRAQRFAAWDYGEMRGGDIGIFHLRPQSDAKPPPAPRKLILRNGQSPGDIVVLTAAIRDLHAAYPGEFETDVRTPCPALWENNPHLTPLRDDGETEHHTIGYPLIHRSNTHPHHFLDGFREDLARIVGKLIPAGPFKGDIHISDAERGWMSQVEEIKGPGTRYWLIVSGGKRDFTAKWWDVERWQAVVDHFAGRILFVQVGESKHHHPSLRGVLDLRGKTDLRQLVRLVYHSDGVACPVTALMHLAAAVPTKPGRSLNRPCVVVAGGREPSQWEKYPHHRYLETNGALRCCDNGGCWKSRVVPLGDGDEKDRSLCEWPVEIRTGAFLPKCLDLIIATHVIDAIEQYENWHQPPPTPPLELPAPSPEPGPEIFIYSARTKRGKRTKTWGPPAWERLHVAARTLATPEARATFLDEFTRGIPCGDCRTGWAKILTENPPRFDSSEDLFAWSVEAHNAVNVALKAEPWTIEQAQARW